MGVTMLKIKVVTVSKSEWWFPPWQSFSTEVNLHIPPIPRAYLTMSGEVSDCHDYGGWGRMLLARDIAQHPTMHKRAPPHIHPKELSCPKMMVPLLTYPDLGDEG